MTEKLPPTPRSEEHTSELQSLRHLVCRLLLEKKINNPPTAHTVARTPSARTDAHPSLFPYTTLLRSGKRVRAAHRCKDQAHLAFFLTGLGTPRRLPLFPSAALLL